MKTFFLVPFCKNADLKDSDVEQKQITQTAPNEMKCILL